MYKLAICGKANTGKNTLGKILVKQTRKYILNESASASYMAFADPIKEMAQLMFPALPRKFLYGSSKFRSEIIPKAFKNDIPLTVRQLLIDIGTAGREYNPEIWVNNFNQRFIEKYHDIIVCNDLRYRNELDYLRNKGFYLIRLYRDTGKPDILHESETSQEAIKDEEFDCILFNNKSLKNLHFEVCQKIIAQLLDR